VGGFAGLSYNFPNAKVSLGYRADFFFGAIDGGPDAAKKENVRLPWAVRDDQHRARWAALVF